MKALLVAVNAKYIHSNLGIYSLKAYADRKFAGQEAVTVQLAEYTINQQTETILQDIYRQKPDVIGFSCYIWNITCIEMLLADMKKVLPETDIWLGGPEVSYDSEAVLRKNPAVLGVMKGEGEETFSQLLGAYVENSVTFSMDGGKLKNIPGLTVRLSEKNEFLDTGFAPLLDMDTLPFAYESIDASRLEHRIIYYESSRGCPFSCAYCLSSIDKSVRFRNIDLVKRELSVFLKARVPQVKFVDRTFNCKKSHAMAIWQFIKENDNGVTNFHFEIAADLIDDEELSFLSSLRPGLVQLEIGVQSVNEKTLSAIRRKTDIETIRRVTKEINKHHNVHQHLDLIAGLPWEDMESFRHSYNEVYSMEPEQLQLGFLKVLKGSYMEELIPFCELRFSSNPPYEVLSTRWLSFEDILELKQVEEMTEVYYNSRQFVLTMEKLSGEYETPYEMYAHLAEYYERKGLTGISHSRLARYEILWDFIGEEVLNSKADEKTKEETRECLRDCLMYDLYLRENAKSRPSFARDQTPFKAEVRDFFIGEEHCPRYLTGYEGYDSRQMAKMAHLEVMGDGSFVLFDYKNRDPLTGNAKAVTVRRERAEKTSGYREGSEGERKK